MCTGIYTRKLNYFSRTIRERLVSKMMDSIHTTTHCHNAYNSARIIRYYSLIPSWILPSHDNIFSNDAIYSYSSHIIQTNHHISSVILPEHACITVLCNDPGHLSFTQGMPEVSSYAGYHITVTWWWNFIDGFSIITAIWIFSRCRVRHFFHLRTKSLLRGRICL